MSGLVVCLMGPTAAGKTALAMSLADQFPCELISVDSAMIYRDMNIGTAKPSLEEQRRYPHRLIDIIDPDQRYSAAQFCQDVKALISEVQASNRLPVLVGGTMMYFNALQHGLSNLPEADEVIRQRIKREAATKGWESLYQQLSQIDPFAAARIHPHDTQRLGRALEVFYQTGISYSELLKVQQEKEQFNYLNIALFPSNRPWLHQRIEQRFILMLAQGFIDEVRELKKRYVLEPSLPSMRCVGYRQVWSYLQGDYDESTLIAKGVAATRQLAKRQLTWLRHWPNAHYFDPENQDYQLKVMAKLREMRDNLQ